MGGHEGVWEGVGGCVARLSQYDTVKASGRHLMPLCSLLLSQCLFPYLDKRGGGGGQKRGV